MDGVLADTEYYYENRRKNFLLENGIPIPEGNFIGSNEKAIWDAIVPNDPEMCIRDRAGGDIFLDILQDALLDLALVLHRAVQRVQRSVDAFQRPLFQKGTAKLDFVNFLAVVPVLSLIHI